MENNDLSFTDELATVKKVLELEDSKDKVILEIINLQYQAVKGYIGKDSVPEELSYVVTETSIARYNRRGFEGSESADRDILSNNFSDDLLKPYKDHLNRFKQKPKNVFKFV